MAKYKITAPDGHTYNLEGPEGASDADLQAQVLAAHPEAAQTPREAAKPAVMAKAKADAAAFDTKVKSELTGSKLGNFAAGVGKSFDDMALGLEQAAESTGLAPSINKVGEFLSRYGVVAPPSKVPTSERAAEKEQIDEPLMETPAGMIGKYGTDIATSLTPTGNLMKAAKAVTVLPKVAKLLPSVGMGALQGVLGPEKDYSLGWEAAKGAAGGLAGEGLGRAIEFARAPLGKAVDKGTQAMVDLLKQQSILKMPTAMNVIDNEGVRALSNALSKVPYFGRKLQQAQAANREGLTEYATGQAGTKMKNVHELYKIEDELNKTAAKFRTQDKIEIPNMSGKLNEAHQAAVEMADTGMGSAAAVNRTGKALNESMRQVVPVAGEAKPVNPSYTADMLMDLRNKASDLAYGATGVEGETYRKLKDIYEKALKSKFGEEPIDEWLKKYGSFKDLARAAESASSTDSGGRLTSAGMANAVKGIATAPPGSSGAIYRAARERMPSFVGDENRSLLTRMLMSGAAAGGVGTLATGNTDPVTILRNALIGGTLMGAGGAAGLGAASKALATPGGAKWLAGEKALDPMTAEWLRKILATTGGEIGR